ncbi:Ras- protein R-Ras2, variant 2 [Balamuthia mandrillaris]
MVRGITVDQGYSMLSIPDSFFYNGWDFYLRGGIFIGGVGSLWSWGGISTIFAPQQQLLVFVQLDLVSIAACSLVCKVWAELTTQDALWKRLLSKHFPGSSNLLHLLDNEVATRWKDKYKHYLCEILPGGRLVYVFTKNERSSCLLQQQPNQLPAAPPAMPVQQFQEKGLPTVNTAVFGEGAVGKTALVHNFLYARRADWGYLPTMEDNKYSCLARLVAKEYIWKIVDTAGQEEYRRAMGDKWMRTGESFIAVFSLMRFDSLVGVQQLITLIHRMKGTNAVPLVLVGTKSDCASKRDARLTDQVIQSYADGLHIPYFEVPLSMSSFFILLLLYVTDGT